MDLQNIHMQAKLLIENGETEKAFKLLQDALKVVDKTPISIYQSCLLLSRHLYELQQYSTSLSVLNEAEKSDPLQDEFSQIQRFIQNNAFAQAEQIAMQMTHKVKGHPRAIYTLAYIAEQKRDSSAVNKYLALGLEVSPANKVLLHMQIPHLENMGKYENAIENAKSLLNIEACFDTLRLCLSLVLKYGQYAKVLELSESYKNEIKLSAAQQSQISLFQAQAHRILGEREKSINACHQSIAQHSLNPEAWWALADMKNYQFANSDINNLKLLAEDPALQKQGRCVAMFAYAKASETLNDWQKSMHLYQQANQLKDSRQYHPSYTQKEFSQRIESFNAKALSPQAETSSSDPKPIFIVGLPRSGSTLVEQILASHSHIESTLEQPTFSCIERQANILCRQKYKQSLLKSVQLIEPNELHKLGQVYLQSSKIFRKQNKTLFTDKFPFNFRQVGLIHKILPQALIIDVRRNPLDCGFSLFKQYFPSGVDFSYNLAHIGAFYREYLALMAHWDSVLPGKVFHLQYETLIKQPEGTIRDLLNYLGLRYENSCLNFHENKNPVHSASSEQVRQALHTNSLESWRQVEGFLDELKAELAEDSI